MVRISLIGSGNVATHLGQSLAAADGCEIIEVCSPRHASELASRLGVRAVGDPSNASRDADLYLISVADDALTDVVSKLPHVPSAIYAHTSGSVAMDVLEGLSAHIGVFYPLQTFSRDVKLDISRVPVFIEGSDEPTAKRLTAIASLISGSVFRADSALRSHLHIAAVFACNFVNHLWAIADGLLARDGLSLEVLHPLLEETLRKAECHHPADVQTGPAAREDRRIIEAHAGSLPESLRDIYLMLSESIINSRK